MDWIAVIVLATLFNAFFWAGIWSARFLHRKGL
jgi:hypothetical protein